MKRFFALLLVCVMLLTLVPTVFAADTASGTCGEVSWTLSDDGILTFSGSGAMADYNSSSYRYVPWSSYSTQINKVVFESGVTYIGSYAFYNYNNAMYPDLAAVEIKGASTTGTHVFKYCRALTSVKLGSLQELGANVFAYCSSLESIEFPATLKTIGYEAFNYCEALKTVVLPEGLETIEYSAFGNCYALTDATVPESVTSIGVHIFNSCKNETVHGYTNSIAYMYCLLGSIPFDSLGTLQTVPVYDSGEEDGICWTFYSDGTLVISGEGAMPDYTDANYKTAPWMAYSRQVVRVIIDKNITHVGDCTFLNISNTFYPKLTSVTVSADATIGDNAFKYCNLTQVELLGAVSSIGESAFAYCDELTEVVIAEGLTEIGYAAFRGCTALEELELPEDTETIGDAAFWGCSVLAELVVPDSVTSVGAETFRNCNTSIYGDTNAWIYMYCLLHNRSFESVGTQDPAAVYDSGTTGDVTWIFYADGTLVIEGEGSVADYTGTDAPWYPYRNQILSLQIGDGVTEIGALAFAGCSKITEVLFEGDAPQIASDAFKNVTAYAYYHNFCEGWTEDVMLNYGGKLTWESIECNHVYDAVVTEPTCLDGGYTTYTCSKCGDIYTADETEALGHDYIATVTEPTCLDAGYTTYTCSRCEDTYTGDETDALGHDYVGVVTEPTCLEKGYTTYTCSRCDDTYVGDETDALGHTEVIDEAVEPTCTETGLTEGSHCAVCGETIVAQQTVPMADHDYVADVTAPTCTADGSVTYTCSCCGATYTEVLLAVECPTKDYKDVPNTSNWGHAGIDFCVDRGIMGSTSTEDLIFEPGTVCTRAMIVSVLYRLSDSPEVEYEAVFPDVPDGQWYSDAVIWGYRNGVVKGYDTGKFGPNDKITREQMAVILKGYTENVVGKDTAASASLESFYDAKKVTWSKTYVEWAVAVGMISGKIQSDGKTMLDPQGNATRAEVASILMRYIQNILE